jgi:electron transport complex protein RnfG
VKQKTSRLPRLLAFSALLFGLLGASPAEATTYFTVPAVLKSFFAQSKKVSHRRVTLSPEAIATIDAKVGAPLAKAEWVVYVGETDGQVDGYAIVDAEKGMHELIDFAVRFSTSGAVERVEVLEYREPYGDEVRHERFRAQFTGKTATSPMVAGQDIDIVSGASISSRSMAVGIKRDALVLAEALKAGAL